MDIQADIKWIKARLDGITDPNLIAVIKSLLARNSQSQNEDWWNDLTIDQQAFLDESLKEMRMGETVSNENVHAQIDRLLREP